MKKQFYKLSLVAFIGLGAIAFGQQAGTVGINVEAPSATLEISPSSDNAATSATTNEGILIPQLSKERVANIADESLTERTMVYVKGTSYSGSNNKVSRINADGFYYYDGNLWVKVGSQGATLNAITGTIRVVDAITPEEWAKPNTFALVQTSEAQIRLPNPADYINKIISVNNQYNNAVSYFATNSPENASSLVPGKGHLLMSDGTTWYIIGGSY